MDELPADDDAIDGSTLPNDWAEALSQRKYETDQLAVRVANIYDGAGPRAVYPPRCDVFRAFHLTRLRDVRVVILGQDPYPQPDQAHGLAFSVPGPVPIPRSLGAVFRNLEGDAEVSGPFTRPARGDLSSWARQGVLLLNTALTVEQSNAGSHSSHWNAFTDLLLRVINEERDHVAFLLWGKHAINRVAAAGIAEPPHLLIKSSHPAAWGKTKEQRFRDSRPFSAANAFLASHKLGTVDWGLGTSRD